MFLHMMIDRLLKLERRIRQIYLNLAERTEFPDALRSLWREMAEDENHHRIYIEQTAGLFNFMVSPPDEVEATLSRIEAAVTAAEVMLEQTELGIDDVLRHALHLEGSELDSLVDAWIEGFQPSLESLTHAAFPEQESHLRRLIDAVQAHSVDQTIHARAAALWSAYQQRKSKKTKTDGGGSEDAAL